MCGISGIFSYHYAASDPDEAELSRMHVYLRPRGPDGDGVWWNQTRRMALGHRRLAIQDLSDKAAQPMISANGRYALTYNGEIYNTPELRRELEAQGATFVSHSDTEVILQLYERKGAAAVQMLHGMFALAIWDNHAETLFLARDPYGIKPLYAANDGWTFRFASQVKALLAGGGVSRDLEPAGLVGFHLFGSVPDPFTLYRDIQALPAGHTQIIDRTGPHAPEPYISLATVLHEAKAMNGDPMGHAHEALRDSVSAHMLADVPVGLFLSSGVDSGALLGLMHDAGHENIHCVTLAFDEFKGTAEDEVPLAAEMANRYGAQHSVYRVTQGEYESEFEQILAAMDQPSIDGVNTWFVAKAAKAAGLKVALSGLGGDELFAGYPSFRDVPRSVALMRGPAMVPGLGALMQIALGSMFPHQPKWKGLGRYGGSWAGAYLLRRGLFLPEELRDCMDPEIARLGLQRLQPLARLSASLKPNPGSNNSRVCALESAWYMRHQLLRDADWAGMAHSVEIRTPLVDIDLLRRMAPLLPQMAPGEGKAILASAPHQALPSAIRDRPKTGFAVPTGHWVTGGVVSNKGLSSRAWAQSVMQRFTDINAVAAS